jgi:hypothetical protein
MKRIKHDARDAWQAWQAKLDASSLTPAQKQKATAVLIKLMKARAKAGCSVQ